MIASSGQVCRTPRSTAVSSVQRSNSKTITSALAATACLALVSLAAFPYLAMLFIAAVIVLCYFLYQMLTAMFIVPEKPQHPNHGWHEVKTERARAALKQQIERRAQAYANDKSWPPL